MDKINIMKDLLKKEMSPEKMAEEMINKYGYTKAEKMVKDEYLNPERGLDSELWWFWTLGYIREGHWFERFMKGKDIPLNLPEFNSLEEAAVDAVKTANKMIKENRLVYAVMGDVLLFSGSDRGKYLMKNGVDILQGAGCIIADSHALWCDVFNSTFQMGGESKDFELGNRVAKLLYMSKVFEHYS